MAEERAIRLDVSNPQVFAALQTVPAEFGKALRKGLVQYMTGFSSPSGAWQRAHLRGRPGLFRRSGELARSFAAVDASKGDRLSGVGAVGFTTSKYARIHEFGGTIVPRHEKRIEIKRRRQVKSVLANRRGPSAATHAETTYTLVRKLLVWRGEDGRWHSARRVTIPARMAWFDSFARDTGGRASMVAKAAQQALGVYVRGSLPQRGPKEQGPSLPPGGGA